MDPKNYRQDTAAVHGKRQVSQPNRALSPPIFQTATFTFDNLEQVHKVMSFESDDYVYTRGNNPTLRQFENHLADLENAAAAVAFSSGMAAISSVLLSFLKPGDRILTSKTIYGSSYSFMTAFLEQYGIGCCFADLTNVEDVEAKLSSDIKVIYLETPANPTLQIIPISKISHLARCKNIPVVVDNTFASPYFQNPLDLGASVVVHSATKYLCGHGDVVGGVAASKDPEYIQKLKFGYMCELGGVMSPFNAWLLLRGMKTLGVRMRRHEENALAVANFLAQHPKVDRVYYPGLPQFPGHDMAKKQMSGFGGILSFEMKGDLKLAAQVVNRVQMIRLAVSLGDCESLIELPAAMTHLGYPKERLAEFGLTETMIRLSVGLEDSRDIIEDLEQAIEGYTKP